MSIHILSSRWLTLRPSIKEAFPILVIKSGFLQQLATLMAGDLVLTLQDGAKVEVRSMPEFDRNLKFMFDQMGDLLAADCGYPDEPAKQFMEKVARGEEPPVELPPFDPAAAAAEA